MTLYLRNNSIAEIKVRRGNAIFNLEPGELCEVTETDMLLNSLYFRHGLLKVMKKRGNYITSTEYKVSCTKEKLLEIKENYYKYKDNLIETNNRDIRYNLSDFVTGLDFPYRTELCKMFKDCEIKYILPHKSAEVLHTKEECIAENLDGDTVLLMFYADGVEFTRWLVPAEDVLLIEDPKLVYEKSNYDPNIEYVVEYDNSLLKLSKDEAHRIFFNLRNKFESKIFKVVRGNSVVVLKPCNTTVEVWNSFTSEMQDGVFKNIKKKRDNFNLLNEIGRCIIVQDPRINRFKLL